MGIFKLINTTSGNRLPTVNNYTLFLNNREDNILTVDMFTSGFDDLDNDLPQRIKLESLPSNVGRFFYNSQEIILGQEITLADIQSNLLTFVAPNQDNQFSDNIQFKVYDGKDYSNTAMFTVIVSKLYEENNNPPLVGNNSFDINYREKKYFTLNNFTTETIPSYYDAEGDAAMNIKISLLPGKGKLYFNEQEVIKDQIISTINITNLYYISDLNTSVSYTSTFGFKIEDTGSGKYSNQGIISIKVAELVATPPTVEDNIGLLIYSEYIFDSTDLTNNYLDTQGDSYSEFTIKTLVEVGVLQYNNSEINADQIISANSITNFKFILSDNYAVHDDILYKFEESIDSIINDYEEDNYKLYDNSDGELLFRSMIDYNDIQIVTSEVITNDKLQFDFIVKDDSILKLESNVATFSLIPTGNVNIKIVYENQPPIVGDKTIQL